MCNPLAELATLAAARAATLCDAGDALLAWSGWIGQPALSVDGNVDADFRSWSGQGRRALDEFVASALGPIEAAGGRLWLRPHARHVLSDGPSCRAFLVAHESACARGALGLVLDLRLVLTDEMRPRRVEHVERLMESLGPLPGIVAVAMAQADWAGELGAIVGALAPRARRLAAGH